MRGLKKPSFSLPVLYLCRIVPYKDRIECLREERDQEIKDKRNKFKERLSNEIKDLKEQE